MLSAVAGDELVPSVERSSTRPTYRNRAVSCTSHGWNEEVAPRRGMRSTSHVELLLTEVKLLDMLIGYALHSRRHR